MIMRENKKRILFVTPPYHCGVVEVAGTWPPLTFVPLAAQAERAGWEAQIYDAMSLRHDHEKIAEHLGRMPPSEHTGFLDVAPGNTDLNDV